MKRMGSKAGPGRVSDHDARAGFNVKGEAVYRVGVSEALAALDSSPAGLEDAEADRRRSLVGSNALPTPHRRRVVVELAAQLTNMFAVVLIVASCLTFFIYFLSSPHDIANLDLAFGILAVVVLNALIGFAQEYSAEQTAEALQAMLPQTARVLRSGLLNEISTEDLVPGDVVVLEAGDTISADCRVIEARNLSVEMAALTGESDPVVRTAEVVTASQGRVDARNCVLMGSSVVNGNGEAVVFATGLDTEFGRIYSLTAALPVEESPLQHQVTDMARRVAAIAIGAGTLLFVLRLLMGNPAALSFVFALGVMVALVPEGLPATLSVSLAIGVRRMARRNALIKRLAAVEALGSTTVICTDKTGTLTKAEMTVQQIYSSARVFSVGGIGYAPIGEVEAVEEVRDLLRVAVLCTNARLIPPDAGAEWKVLGDTTEGAIIVAAAKAGIDKAAEEKLTPRVGEFPFDADRKLMTTLHSVGNTFEAYVKGSPQAVLDRCSEIWWNGRSVPLDDEHFREVTRANDAMASQALRVLAIAKRQVPTPQIDQEQAEHGLVFIGLMGMVDPPRTEVMAAVDACERAGIRIYMVTGDYGLTAEAVARKIGIVGSGPAKVMSGGDLDGTSEDALSQALQGRDPIIFARVRPEQKLRIVSALEKLGEIVAVTGDGANDAPALKRASIGVAMGEGGTDVARAAAVMVLLDDSFASIVAAVDLGRAVYQNIRRFLIYIFSHNLAELAPILVATLVGFPLVPLSALQVLAIDLGSDVLPALALGAEAPEADTMNRPPRPPSEHLFSWSVVRRFLFLGLIQSAGVVFAFFWRIHTAHLPFSSFNAANPTYREALTMTQAGIVVSQFFNSFAVRTERESVFRSGIWSNPWLVIAGGIALAIMASISYVPLLQSVFHTAPLKITDWVMLVSFGLVLLLAEEGRKAWNRHRS